ncbi:AKHSDH2 [Symbiodinium natans]|uniref:aspartate kinase n=1 Tax=Symbiodinium natans TaxID=878477 RepID=A0A812P470_9DINO|nr:AKHSDH2 [Symbiodinium natans]
MLVAIIDSALRDSNSLTSRYKAQALMRFLKKEGHPKLILIGWREIELVFLHQHPLHQLTSVEESREKLKAAADRQKSILLELVPDKPELTDKVIANIDKDQEAVEAMALAASQMRGVPPQMMELVAGLGEVWSAQTLCAYMSSTGARSEWIDARDILIVPDGPLSGLGEKGTAVDTIEPFWDETSHRLQKWWESTVGEADAPFLVITGFVCSTVQGRPTTLKRSGSDYSATIFAKVLDSSNVTFWKNVSGVYTADPRAVPEAFPINSMTFDEAMELAYFGGQVLHPSAMVPCIENRIPVLVKNVFDPAHPGTRVYGRGDAVLRWDDQSDEDSADQMPVKAITSIEKVSLITIAGTSFMGTHGVAKRFMEALSNVGVNVILTSQGSSEHSITVAVADTDGKMAMRAVESAFQFEIQQVGSETRVTMMEGLSILAVIGEGMKNSTGISGRFFNALGRSKVNIVAIAQGSSERNISAVVSREDLSLALRATHDAFLMKESTISVSVVGGGEIGTAFVNQLVRWQTEEGRDFTLPSLREVQYINIDLRSFCDSNKMLLAQNGLPLIKLQDSITNGVFNLKEIADEWEKAGKAVSEALTDGVEMVDTDLDHFVQFTESKEYPHKVIVDCSSSADIAAKYPEWLQRGFHVITPNRSALIGSYKQYQDCLQYVGKDSQTCACCFALTAPFRQIHSDSYSYLLCQLARVIRSGLDTDICGHAPSRGPKTEQFCLVNRTQLHSIEPAILNFCGCNE